MEDEVTVTIVLPPYAREQKRTAWTRVPNKRKRGRLLAKRARKANR